MDKSLTIYLFHTLFVAPLLFYIGYMNNFGSSKPNKMIYNLLILLAIVVFSYHSYRAYSHL